MTRAWTILSFWQMETNIWLIEIFYIKFLFCSSEPIGIYFFPGTYSLNWASLTILYTGYMHHRTQTHYSFQHAPGNFVSSRHWEKSNFLAFHLCFFPAFFFSFFFFLFFPLWRTSLCCLFLLLWVIVLNWCEIVPYARLLYSCSRSFFIIIIIQNNLIVWDTHKCKQMCRILAILNILAAVNLNIFLILFYHVPGVADRLSIRLFVCDQFVNINQFDEPNHSIFILTNLYLFDHLFVSKNIHSFIQKQNQPLYYYRVVQSNIVQFTICSRFNISIIIEVDQICFRVLLYSWTIYSWNISIYIYI